MTSNTIAISRMQWGDILAASLSDHSLNAIVSEFDFESTYELVDSLPGETTLDGRYIVDVAVNFMYPTQFKNLPNTTVAILSN